MAVKPRTKKRKKPQKYIRRIFIDGANVCLHKSGKKGKFDPEKVTLCCEFFKKNAEKWNIEKIHWIFKTGWAGSKE